MDGAPSSDPVVGWGPRDGRVFQKSFVEFFALKEEVEKLIGAVQDFGDGWVTFFAGDNEVSHVPGHKKGAVVLKWNCRRDSRRMCRMAEETL